MTEIDAVIEDYKRQLTGAAELAKADLDEIEDHLRALTTDLQTGGLPAMAAVREAARRLGEPAAVAREHARVRTVFGARLSAFRTYSAVALLVAMLVYSAIEVLPYRETPFLIEFAFGVILTGALAFRLSWARPIVIGGLGFLSIEAAVSAYLYPSSAIWLVFLGGAFAFLVPWRRAELTGAGWALALQVWTYVIGMFFDRFMYSDPDSTIAFNLVALAAAAFAVLATCGTILRARWSAVASLGSVVMLALVAAKLWTLRFAFTETFWDAYINGALITGIVTGLCAVALSWRTARSTLGTFQHVFR